jgi:hypothetical protein
MKKPSKLPKETPKQPEEPPKPKKSYGLKFRVIKLRCYEATDET